MVGCKALVDLSWNAPALPHRIPSTLLCRLCGRLDDLISEPTRAVGATVTAGTVTLIGLPRMAR